MTVPAAAAPRAMALSPSGWAKPWNATGATSTGRLTSVPRTVVAVVTSETSTSIRGRSTQRRKAARFSPSVHSSFAPPAKYAEGVRVEPIFGDALVIPDVEELAARYPALKRAASSEPPVASPALYECAPAPASCPASTIRYSSRIGLPSNQHSRISRTPAA